MANPVKILSLPSLPTKNIFFPSIANSASNANVANKSGNSPCISYVEVCGKHISPSGTIQPTLIINPPLPPAVRVYPMVPTLDK